MSRANADPTLRSSGTLRNMSGSCLARVRARLRGETKTTVKIARFILASPARARNMSIGELASACGTSAPTISRFAATLGYGGYKQFRLDLAAAVAQAEGVTLDEFAEGVAPEAIVRQVFQCNRQSLVETEKVLDQKALIRVARLIRKARKILFLGIGESGRVARTGAQRFTSLGLTAIAVTDPYDQIFASADVGRDSVVIGISHTGQTAHIIEAVQAARRRGARTVALTNYPQSPLAGACEFRLLTAFREHRISAAVSSSRIAQTCIIDSLYFIVASWAGQGAKRLADEAEERVRRMVRTAPKRERSRDRKDTTIATKRHEKTPRKER